MNKTEQKEYLKKHRIERMEEWTSKLRLFPCCDTWCRTWDETRDGEYPPSDHAPGCPEHKLEKFIRVKMPDGAILTVEPSEVKYIIEEESDWAEPGDARPVVLGEIMLTADQVEKMPDYEP